MSEHTKGPWMLSEHPNGPFIGIYSEHSVGGDKCKGGRQAIASVHYESKKGAIAYHKMFLANARRIVACVNALEGMPIEDINFLAQKKLNPIAGNLFSSRMKLERRIAELEKQAEALIDITLIAHFGGLANVSGENVLIAVRKVTIPFLKDVSHYTTQEKEQLINNAMIRTLEN